MSTWVCFTNDEMERLRFILDQAPAQIYGVEEDCKQLLNRIDTYLAPEAKDPGYRAAAADLNFVRDGECEIDDHAVVSASDEGAYVMAWVWVYAPEEEE